MGRALSPLTRDVVRARQEVKEHQEEISRLDRELAGHYGAIARAAARREYLQELIQANEKMIASCRGLGGLGPTTRRGRQPSRPRKVARPAPRARRRRVWRAAPPRVIPVISQRFAALSVTDTAEQVLKTARKPVHLSEIITQIMAGGKVIRSKQPHISIRYMIARDKRFRKTGRNIWALA